MRKHGAVYLSSAHQNEVSRGPAHSLLPLSSDPDECVREPTHSAKKARKENSVVRDEDDIGRYGSAGVSIDRLQGSTDRHKIHHVVDDHQQDVTQQPHQECETITTEGTQPCSEATCQQQRQPFLWNVLVQGETGRAKASETLIEDHLALVVQWEDGELLGGTNSRHTRDSPFGTTHWTRLGEIAIEKGSNTTVPSLLGDRSEPAHSDVAGPQVQVTAMDRIGRFGSAASKVPTS